jgi:hypothetical protein
MSFDGEFAMSVFKLPKGVCKKITDAISEFLWEEDDWHAWWKLCFSKKEGDTCLRDLHSFNLALLAK